MYRCATPPPWIGHYDPYRDASVIGHAADGSPLWLPWEGTNVAVVVGIPPQLSTPFSHHVLHGLVGWAQVVRCWLPSDRSAPGAPHSDYGLRWPKFRDEDARLLPRRVFMAGPLASDMDIDDFTVCLVLGATLPPRDKPWEDIRMLATVATVEDIPEPLRGKVTLTRGDASCLNNLL